MRSASFWIGPYVPSRARWYSTNVQANALTDLSADLRQVRRIFQARLQDDRYDGVESIYQQQLDAVLMSSVDGMEQTLDNNWRALDLTVKMS